MSDPTNTADETMVGFERTKSFIACEEDRPVETHLACIARLEAEIVRLRSEAAKQDGMDMAAWARPILIDAAQRRLAKSGNST